MIQWAMKMLDFSKSHLHSQINHGAILVGLSLETKKEEIAVSTILRQPRKVGFLISEVNILLGLKTEGILGKNIDLASFHKLAVGNLSRPYQAKKGLEREVLSKQQMVT